MHHLKKIIDFYVFSNLHVAVAGFCITKLTLIKYGFMDNATPLFVALSIVLSYNFIRFYEIKTGSLNWYKKWFQNHFEFVFILSLGAFFGMLYMLFFKAFHIGSIIVLIPFGIMTFFYVLPVWKNNSITYSFRNFPRIKIFSIAISWAGVSVLFPLYEKGLPFDLNVWLEFIQRILILIAIIIPFDIRDMELDSEKLKTIPQTLGIQKTKILAYIFLLLFISLEFLKYSERVESLQVVFLISLLTAILVYFSKPNQSRFYTSFWVESVPIIWLILIIVFSF